MKKNQKGFSVVEGLLILIVVGLLAFVGWYVYHTKRTSSPTKTSTTPTLTQTTTKDYTDTSGTYSLKYPSDWTVKEQPDDSAWDPSLPAHLKSLPAFTPSNLSAGASNDLTTDNVQVIAFRSDDPEKLLKLYRGGGVNISPKATTINGYPVSYYQDVQPTTKSGNGSLGYTDDYYAVTHNSITLLFSFREKQTDTSTSSFDSSNIVPAYTELVKSVKFLN